jgi:peroxiredoxin
MKAMKDLNRIIVSLACLLISTNCVSQVRMDIIFSTLKNGKVTLSDVSGTPIGNFDINDNRVSIEVTGQDHLPVFMVVNEYNNTRPMQFLLSDRKTIIQFDTLIKVKETSTFSDIYPNRPKFISYPDKNEVFYGFQAQLVAFADSISFYSQGAQPNNLLEKRKEIYQRFIENSSLIIKRNSDEFIAATIIDYLITLNLLGVPLVQDFYDHLSEQVKQSYFGLVIAKELGVQGDLAGGKPAPQFKFIDLEGESIELMKISKKKIILHFWSASCAPCIRESPELLKLRNDFGSSVQIINLSNDKDRNKWLRGIQAANLTEMINVLDSTSNIFNAYAIHILPSYYLIDEQKSIVKKGTLEQIKSSLGIESKSLKKE